MYGTIDISSVYLPLHHHRLTSPKQSKLLQSRDEAQIKVVLLYNFEWDETMH